MGLIFWNLGSGAERFYMVPRSLTVLHREHFAGYRQEETYIRFDRVSLVSKVGYLGGMELRDEDGNRIGDYSASFVGLSGVYTTVPLGTSGWAFGVGPGFLLSKIHSYTDWALTANVMAYGSFKDGRVLLKIDNLGVGSLVPVPETFAGGYLYLPQSTRVGGFLRFFGDVDLDAGLYLAKRISVLDLEVVPSYRYVTFGLSLGVGPLKFRYQYTQSYYGLGSHIVGMTFFWGAQRGIEERIGTLEVKVARHEKEIESIRDRIARMEMEAEAKAQDLLRRARRERDPEKALRLAEMAAVFHSSPEADFLIDSLKGEVVKKRKERHIKRINAFLRNRMYADAYAEALEFVREFPDDPRAIKLFKELEARLNRRLKQRRKLKQVKTQALDIYADRSIRRADSLINSHRYLDAYELIKSLPDSPEKVALLMRIKDKSKEYLDSARTYIKRKEWAKARAYLEAYLDLTQDPKAVSLLQKVNESMERQAEYHYMRALEMFQKGDILGAYAHAEVAYELQPHNEKYRKVYERLSSLYRRYGR